jgi:acetyl-CoA carboxylase biotin carboxyl carrier protein
MSDRNTPFQAAIDDARTLLDTLLASDWHDIHVVSAETEIFIARDGGRANPMRRSEIAANPPASELPDVSDESQVVTAPHVATVVDVLPIGTQVESGARLATIRVLDGEEDVPAPQSGTVIAIHAPSGALVEFKAPIVSLRAGAR